VELSIGNLGKKIAYFGWPYLVAVDERGARFELHPDGNSLDFFQGLLRKKLPR